MPCNCPEALKPESPVIVPSGEWGHHRGHLCRLVGLHRRQCQRLPTATQGKGRQGRDGAQGSLMPTMNFRPRRHGSVRAGLKDDSRNQDYSRKEREVPNGS